MFDRIKSPVAQTLIVALFFALSAQAEEVLSADTVMANVDGTEITLGHMIALRASLPPQYADIPANILFDGILDQLVQQTLLMQSFRGDLTRQSQLTLENERRAFIAGDVIANVMDAPITEDALQRAYEKQYATQKTEYSAAHILVDTENEAKDLIEQLAGDANFAALAREHSTGPSGAGGGNLGWFSEGRMVDVFFDAVVKLKPGGVSPPVESEFGWHVIMLKETRSMERPELEDVRAEIEAELHRVAFDTYIDELTNAAKIDRPEFEDMNPEIVNKIEFLEN